MKNFQAQNNLDNKEEKTNSMGFCCTVSRFTSKSLFGLCQCTLTFFLYVNDCTSAKFLFCRVSRTWYIARNYTQLAQQKRRDEKLDQLCGSKFFNSLLDVYFCLSFGLWNCWLKAFGKNRIDTFIQVEGIIFNTLIHLKAKYPKERWRNYSNVVKGGQLTTPQIFL